MRIKKHSDMDYTMWLSANDTYRWANKPGARWPCSQLADRRIVVEIDANGLCDYAIDGGHGYQNIDGSEIEACVSDHLPADLRHLWPAWG